MSTVRYTGRDEPRCAICSRKVLYLQWVKAEGPLTHVHCTNRRRNGYRAHFPDADDRCAHNVAHLHKRKLHADLAKLVEKQYQVLDAADLHDLRLTLVARDPDRPQRFLILSDDTMDGVIDVAQRAKNSPQFGQKDQDVAPGQ